MVDVDVILSKLCKGSLPTEQEIKGLCDSAREIFDKLDNVANLSYNSMWGYPWSI